MWFDLFRQTLFKHIVRQSRVGDVPSLYVGIERIVLLLAVSMLLWTYAGRYVLIAGTVIFTGLPLLAAFIAANLAVRVSTSGQYQLIALTPITDRLLMRCFYETAISRVRRGLIAAGVFIPMLVLGAVLLRWEQTLVPGESSVRDAALPLILYVALGFVLWGMNLVGIAVGVGLGIWSRGSLALVVAPGLVAIMMLGLVGFLMNLIEDASLSVAMRTAIVGALIPYLVPWIILRMAEPAARRQQDL